MGAVRLVRYTLRDAPDSDAGVGFLSVLEEYKQQFLAAMDDDFNAPLALGVLQNLTREVNTLLNSGEEMGRATLKAIDNLYQELGGDVLGIIPDEMAERGIDTEQRAGLIELLIDLRNEARQGKDFARADMIRTRLMDLGVNLEDRPDGTVYKLQ